MASTPSRFIKTHGVANYEKHVNARLEPLLAELLDAPKHPRAEHPKDTIPNSPGLYLFSDAHGTPIYVGQSRDIASRLAQHTRLGSKENQASFAFIAKREARDGSIDIVGFDRKNLSVRPDFEELFDDAKAQVALMPVQFVVEAHADLRTVFEVYATYALGTQEFNTFETH